MSRLCAQLEFNILIMNFAQICAVDVARPSLQQTIRWQLFSCDHCQPVSNILSQECQTALLEIVKLKQSLYSTFPCLLTTQGQLWGDNPCHAEYQRSIFGFLMPQPSKPYSHLQFIPQASQPSFVIENSL